MLGDGADALRAWLYRDLIQQYDVTVQVGSQGRDRASLLRQRGLRWGLRGPAVDGSLETRSSRAEATPRPSSKPN